MKTNYLVRFKFRVILVLFLSAQLGFSQGNLFSNSENANADDVVMTWNKDTSEQEMKDDIKAMAEKGITIKYKDVKRNSKNEITAIKVSYEDRKGNKGDLNYSNVNAINDIIFSKNGDFIGFGENTNSDSGFASNFGNIEDVLKKFQMQSNQNNSGSFQFPGEGKKSGMSVRQEIRSEGKKPVIIENGKIIEGGDDYTKEQLEEMLKNNKENNFVFGKSFDSDKAFDFRYKNDLNAFKEKFGETFGNDKNEMKTATEELKKAKEEMQKAKEELEKAKKQIQEKQTTKKQ
ncbi:MAG: hypothetical protein ACI9XR_001722 [Flavobacterium sp.]|jgi:hypothetical protein